MLCSWSERCGEWWSQLPVNTLFNKLCPEQTHRECHVPRVQNLKCTLPRAPTDLSFICMTVFSIMNFILNVSQLAELSVGPTGFALPLLALSLQTNCLIQTQPPPYNPHALCEMLHMGLFLSLYCISLSLSLSHTHEYTALFFLHLNSQSDT